MKKTKGVQQGVQLPSSINPKISIQQQEILHLLTKDFLTVKKIAKRRQTTIYAVYKTLNKLKKKGLISGSVQGGYKIHTPLTKGGYNKIRLHGEIYNLRFINTQLYNNLQKQRNRIEIDGNTIRLFTNSILIYSNKHFTGKDTTATEIVSEKYWSLFFKQLEDKLKVDFLKVKRVMAHYAELNNELAIDANNKKDHIKIRGKDKKVWLLTDNSFKLNELETIHSKEAKEDMDKIKPFFNDLRENPIKISEILGVIKLQAEQNKETASGLNAVVKLIENSMPKPDTKNKKIPDYFG